MSQLLLRLAAWVPSAYQLGVAVAACAAIDLIRRLFFLKRTSFRGRHVLVTGGSQGIGKELARALLARGARVTLLARTESKLSAASDELHAEMRCAGARKVQHVAADTTNEAKLKAAVAKAVEQFGPVDCLVACAGNSNPGLFLDQTAADFRHTMDLNYMGTLHSIKAVIEPMVRRRDGQIIIVSSGLAVTAMMGYSSYTPSKWALRGLADTLRNEFIGLGVTVQISYPPDTETPGFAHENETKPIETASMVPVDIYPAPKVAECMLRGAEAGLYHLPSPDPILNWMVSGATGVSPRAYPFLECFLLPVCGLIEVLAQLWFDMWGRRYAKRHIEEEAKRK
jgi:3-dehydrosphinganine reductase